MTTMQLLAMQYGFKAMIPLEIVAKDYLTDISKTELHRKAKEQKFGFACVNTGTDKRPRYLVPLENLASWLDSTKKETELDHRAMQ
ncbi:pyocin activator PrtN family protein [Moraxella lacunata]|nr:pyocin activator PrtN family protein [Moraxella lacunata]